MTIEKIFSGFEPTKKNVLAVIKEVQKEFGYVSEESVEKCADFFGLRPAAIYSAASFYDHIETKLPPSIVVKVCDSANCCTKKAEQVLGQVESCAGLKEGDEFNENIQIRRESCFGLCAQGPIIEVNGVIFEKATPEKVDDILRPYLGR